MLEASRHVVGVRWQPFVEGYGRRGAALEGAGEVDVLGVLEKHLVVSAGGVGGGRGSVGWMEVGEGRVVN